MDLSKLKELGLTEGEIKVYLALLSKGLSTKGIIAREAKVSESKVYEILHRLKDKGLTSFVKKKKGTKEVIHFKATSPVLLKSFLEKKKLEITREEKILETLLPSLLAHMNADKDEYSAVIYEGFKGIRANNAEVLNMIDSDDEWIAMGTRSSKNEKYNLFWVNWLKQRAKKGGPAKILFVDKNTWYYDQLKKIQKTQVGFLDSIAPTSVAITKNRVMIFTYDETPTCLAITNASVAASFKGFFESLWTISK
jgi:sugar-specific transcriptional regulator TrmB